MKPRHAAALVLVGWALIFPPMTADIGPTYIVNIGAPVNEWVVMRKGFVTAHDCEHFRAHGTVAEYADLTKGHPKADVFFHMRAFSRCVPDDDPRLKGN